MLQKKTLSNGLRILTIPGKETQAAVVLALVGTGSKYETKDISGISHFLEHMFFKGTKKMKKPRDVAEELDKIGGQYNAFTGEEYTGYYARVNASHLNRAIDWVADIFLNSVFPAKEIEKERGVIIEEINMYQDNPMMYVEQVFKEALYGDQPAGWDIAGTKETVSSIKRKEIMDYMSSQYKSENTIICVAGKIDEKEVVKKVENAFKKIGKGNFKKKTGVVENQKRPNSLGLFKKTGQTNLALGVRGYNLFNEDRFVLNVLSIILGGMMSSRLFEEVREKMGAAYYIRTFSDSNTDTGHLATFAGVDNNKFEKVILAILKEYKNLKEQKVGLKELNKAKEVIKGRLALSFESSYSKAMFFANEELLKGEILTLRQIFAKIDKVKPDDLIRVARDVFKEENLNLAFIGPHNNNFKKILKL